MTHPDVAIDLEIQLDHSQVYIYSGDSWGTGPNGHDSVLLALDDARQSERFVGVVDGLIDLVTPVQWNLHAPMRVERWPTEPSSDDENWDHVVDVDLDVPDGKLSFMASGGWAAIPCEVPPGNYRARVSGRGYDAARSGAEGMDSYRLRLWSRAADRSPELRKSWPGWKDTGW